MAALRAPPRHHRGDHYGSGHIDRRAGSSLHPRVLEGAGRKAREIARAFRAPNRINQ